MGEQWTRGDAYERFMGRWSRRVAPVFLEWLGAGPGLRWADVGCGSGALTAAVLQHASPRTVLSVDPAAAQVDEAARRVHDPRVSFGVATAEGLPVGSFDVVVSGLVLNFVPDLGSAVGAMGRAASGPGRSGLVAGYVWDYAEGIQLLRIFWATACAVDPTVADLNEGHRFQIASPAALVELWEEVGLHEVRSTAITVPTVFESFEDFWSPFLGGQGPAPAYVATLDEPRREELREALESALPTESDGTIPLTARAWAVSGTAG